jgi:hypothetical protein
LSDEVLVWQNAGIQGRYANCFRIGFNAFEIMIDFAQAGTNHQVAEVHTRIVLNPAYSRELLQLLASSIAGYEQAHGPIAKAEQG